MFATDRNGLVRKCDLAPGALVTHEAVIELASWVLEKKTAHLAEVVNRLRSELEAAYGRGVTDGVAMEKSKRDRWKSREIMEDE